MKGLVLSLKPFKQKNSAVFTGELAAFERQSAEPKRPATLGRGFFRDSSGNIIEKATDRSADSSETKEDLSYVSNISRYEPQKSSVKRREKAKRDFVTSDTYGVYLNDSGTNSGYITYTNGFGESAGAKVRNGEAVTGRENRADLGGNSSKSIGFYNVEEAQLMANISERDSIKKHIISVVFALALLFGVICGAVVASGVDLEIIKGLEFLMFTEAGAEGTNGALEVFSTAFAVNFIYLTVVFLVGLSPWGIGVIPFVCLLKGFEIGLVATYLVSVFDWGMTYYFLVIAPGIFLFALALIIQSGHSVRVSYALGRFLFTVRQDSGWIRENIKNYMYKSGTMMILATVAALVNTFMWMICFSMFEL